MSGVSATFSLAIWANIRFVGGLSHCEMRKPQNVDINSESLDLDMLNINK